MKNSSVSLAVALVGAVAAVRLPIAAHAAPPGADDGDIGREVLAPDDGWAAAEGGTTGGSAATEDDVFHVDTFADLQEAVQGEQPKIVYVDGELDAWTAEDGSALTCEDFNRDGYTLSGYLDAYDPSHWDGAASGEMEDARQASYEAFREHIQLRPGSNTTIVGADGASITHAHILLSGVDNVIVRDLGVHDAYDCFPKWRGSDWDAQFDNFEISGSTHVWLDHLTVDNGDTVDAEQPLYFGERLDVHDGAIDIVRGSDLVTVSWNRVSDHDKTMLIGNTDSDAYDEWDKLRVTLHHNLFENVGQRAPRLRYGQVHVYNNVFRNTVDSDYHYYYSFGAGVHSTVYAENNVFEMPGIEPGSALRNWGGESVHIEGTVFNGKWVDVLEAHNRAHPDQQLSGTVDRVPALHGKISPTRSVTNKVDAHAGAGAGS